MYGVERRNGKRVVNENTRNVYYELKHDWPLDTTFNINNYSPKTREMFPDIKPHMEVFTNGVQNGSYISSEQKTIEECEDTCWSLYQTYENCAHEFIRENLKGEHYSNGTGFCKKCGMFKSKAFLPETLCKHCQKPTNNVDLTEEPLCEKCQRKLGVMSYGYCRFMNEEYLKSNYPIDKFELNNYSLYIKSNSLEVWYYLTPTVDEGIYQLYLRDAKGKANLPKRIIFQAGRRGLNPYGYFTLPIAEPLLIKRYNTKNRSTHADNLEYVFEEKED